CSEQKATHVNLHFPCDTCATGCNCRAAEQRYELAPSQWIELHSVPAAKPDCSISNWQGSVSGYRHFDDDMPPDIETDDHHSSFVDRKGHPNIQEAGSWIGLWSLSASKPLTFRTSDQITHQINMATPITGTNVTRIAPTTTNSSPIQNVRIWN